MAQAQKMKRKRDEYVDIINKIAELNGEMNYIILDIANLEHYTCGDYDCYREKMRKLRNMRQRFRKLLEKRNELLRYIARNYPEKIKYVTKDKRLCTVEGLENHSWLCSVFEESE